MSAPLQKISQSAMPNASALKRPLTKVTSAANPNSAFLSQQAIDLQQSLDKLRQVKQQQQCKPMPEYQEIDNSTPSKIINIYAQPELFNEELIATTYSTIKNGQEPKTYNKMTNDEAELMYMQRQKEIKQKIDQTKKGNRQLKSALKKSNTVIEKATSKSQQIDLSKTCTQFRRKSIEQPNKRIPSPILQADELQQALQLKKSKLLQDIQLIDNEIGTLQNYSQVQSSVSVVHNRNANHYNTVGTINTSVRQSKVKGNELYHQGLMMEDKKQLKKKIADREKLAKEMQQCTFKPQINNSSRNMNCSTYREDSRITPQTSPKQGLKYRKPILDEAPRVNQRSISQDILRKKSNGKQQDGNEKQLNDRIRRINDKYQAIVEQANRLQSKIH